MKSRNPGSGSVKAFSRKSIQRRFERQPSVEGSVPPISLWSSSMRRSEYSPPRDLGIEPEMWLLLRSRHSSLESPPIETGISPVS